MSRESFMEKYFRFYKLYPEIVDSVSPQSGALLSWTHYRVLLQVEDKTARDWYTKEAANQTWSVRTLQRNISSQYYYRLLKSQNQEPVKQEMEKLTAGYQADKLEFIKNPMITEFLGLSGSTDFTESKLESCIITNIQKFLMELGKGNAAEDAFVEINDRVKKLFMKVNPTASKIPDGHTAMNMVFSDNAPLVEFCDRSTETGSNIQKGYMQMLAGAMSALRNPKAHANITITKDDAMRRLMFASMLMYKIDEAIDYSKIQER